MMVWVVGKEGALGAGVGGNCSSGMDGSKTISRRCPGRGSVYYPVWWISILGWAFKRGKARKKYKKRRLKWFRSHIILKYTPAMRSRIWSTMIFAISCIAIK